MYFPYLRGRQFELIALRELVENSLIINKIIPIVEPVKLSSTLIKTIQAFKDSDMKLAIVWNPQVGDFLLELKREKNESLKDKFLEIIKSDNIIASCYMDWRLKTQIVRLLSDRKEIISICNNKDAIPVYETVFSEETPLYSLIPDESTFRRKIRHNRVMMNDRFKKQNRNTDYAAIDDEPFSDDHLFYREDGYVGFSDYSIIGNEYSDTGFAPYAVAIHIVYFTDDKSLRIRHFVSDSNDDITDPARKFAEAVCKLVEWNKTAGLHTRGINTFTEMYKSEVYPGLGTVKKLSIMHHIELIASYLGEVGKR